MSFYQRWVVGAFHITLWLLCIFFKEHNSEHWAWGEIFRVKRHLRACYLWMSLDRQRLGGDQDVGSGWGEAYFHLMLLPCVYLTIWTYYLKNNNHKEQANRQHVLRVCCTWRERWAEACPPLVPDGGRQHTPSILIATARALWELCVLSLFSCVQLFSTLRTIACKAPLSLEFSRQEEYWSGLPCPPPGFLPYPGMEPKSLMPPALTDGFFTTSTTWEALSSGSHSSWFFFFFYFLAIPQGRWGLSSPTRDGTRAPCDGSTES